MVGDELQRALAAELDVGLVHDHERVGRCGETGHHVERLRGAGRVVRRADEDHVGRAGERLVDRGLGEHERVVEPAARHLGVGEPAQTRVQQVGRLEDRRGAAGAAVGEEQLGEHLVRAVRGPRALDRVAEVRGEVLAQPGHLAVGVAVQRQVADRARELLAEPLRERVRALVRVEARGDLELRGDVGRHVADARAGRGRGAHAGFPSRWSFARASIAFAWPTRPSARAIRQVPGANREAASPSISTTEVTVT